MGAALLEVFKPLLRQQIPEIVDVWLPPETRRVRQEVLLLRFLADARARCLFHLVRRPDRRLR